MPLNLKNLLRQIFLYIEHMNYRLIEKCGLKVSEIGFGCMSLGKNTEGDSISLIHKAMDAGVNYFDTADIYDNGANEEIVGKALKHRRKNIILATKVGNVIKPGGGKDFDWNPSKKHILKSIDDSLKRLQTDYIDIYQLHGGTIDDPIDETIEAFELLKQQGKILNYGISSIRPNVIREYVNRSNIVSVMLQYSYLDRRPEEAILDLLQKNNIAVFARGALAQGFLADKQAKEYLEFSKEEVEQAKRALQDLDKNNSCSAIGYVLTEPVVSAVVIGFRTEKQLIDIIDCKPKISPNKHLDLRNSMKPMKYLQHR